MKYFICALDGMQRNSAIYLGISAEQTERIIPAGEIQADEAAISLPELFQLKDRNAPHGLILKPACAVKTVLLAPRIEDEMEIAEESIHQLPQALSAMHQYFRGAYFTGNSLILILDPEKLVEGLAPGAALIESLVHGAGLQRSNDD